MHTSRISPNISLFVVTSLTENFVDFLLLPSKVHADVQTDWQYRKAKMTSKSEMYVKYGQAIF